MQSNELQLIVKEAGLEPTKVESLLSTFTDYFQQAKTVADSSKGIVVTSEDQEVEMANARQARLKLKDIRVKVENTRKELKEQSLREGRAIDGIANVIKALIVPVEEHLEKQEKFAEEIEKKKKAAKLQARIDELSQFVPDVTVYDLANMSNETYGNVLTSAKEAKRIAEEAAAKAEADRIAAEKAEAERQEKIRLENVQLKKDAEKREAEIAAEKKKIAEEQAKKDEEIRKAKEATEKVEKELAEKKKAEEDAKKAAEEKLAKEKAEKEEAAKQAELAPDKEKMRIVYQEIQKVISDIELTKLTFVGAHKVAEKAIEDLKTTLANMAEGMKNL